MAFAVQARSGFTPSAVIPTRNRSVQAGDHLVCDQEDPVPIADVADHRHEAFMGDDAAGAKNRFHDEGGNAVGPLKGDFIGKGRGTKLGKSHRIRLVERVAIGVGRRDVVTAWKKRFVLGPEIRVAIDAGAADMRAVIAFLQAEELDPSRLTANLVVLPCQAKRGLDTVAAAGCIEGTLQAVRLENCASSCDSSTATSFVVPRKIE